MVVYLSILGTTLNKPETLAQLALIVSTLWELSHEYQIVRVSMIVSFFRHRYSDCLGQKQTR